MEILIILILLQIAFISVVIRRQSFRRILFTSYHLGKGHSRAAVSLWNNILEPVAEKEWQWYDSEYVFRCPSEKRPYLFTRKNSQQSMERIPARK